LWNGGKDENLFNDSAYIIWACIFWFEKTHQTREE